MSIVIRKERHDSIPTTLIALEQFKGLDKVGETIDPIRSLLLLGGATTSSGTSNICTNAIHQ
jgi:hypothetical protein